MLTLRCFGSAAVYDDTTTEDLPLRSRKHLGLLLYLACHPKTLHTREELAVLLWDDAGPRERHSLSQALYDIRSKLGPVLEADTTTVQFRADRLRCEAQQFENAVERGDHETALELFRGEFAPNLIHLGCDTFDRWLDGERERHRVLALLALRNAQKAAEESGDWDRSCLAALRLIRLNDFDEKSHRALMRGLWMKGDAASALAHYEALKARWPRKDERGLAPKTQALAQALRGADGSAPSHEHAHVVGRGRELRHLSEALTRVRSLPCQRVLICGEPGSGKSTILQTFSRLCLTKGIDAIRVNSDPPVLSVAFAQGRDTLVETQWPGDFSFLESISRGQKPCAVLIDDLWGISESLATPLAQVLKRGQNPNLLIIATVDSVQQALHEASNKLAEFLSAAPTRTIELGPLQGHHLESIIKSRVSRLSPINRPRAAELAGGNPAYALEIARLLEGMRGRALTAGACVERRFAMPEADSLRAILTRRLAPLDPSTRHLLTHIAIGGAGFHEDAMKRLSTWSTRALSDRLRFLAQLHLIVRVEGGWDLRHPIIEHFVISEMTHLERAATHMSVASTLDNGTREGALAAARHLAKAGERTRAFKNAITAASLSVRQGAFAEAVDAAQLAETVASTTQEVTEARLAEGFAHLRAGRYGDAELLLSHLGLTEDLPESRRHDVIAAQAEVAISKAAWSRARRLLARLDAAGSAKATFQAASLRLRAATAESDSNRLNHAAAELATLLQAMRRPPPHLQRHWFDAWKALLQFRLSHDSIAAATQLFSMFAEGLQSATPAYEQEILQARGVLLIRQGALSEAQRLLGRALTKANVNRPTIITSGLLNNYGVTQLETGDFANASALFDRCITIDATLGVRSMESTMPLLNKATCLLYKGSGAEAATLFRKAKVDTAAIGANTLSCESAACLALLALLEGNVGPTHALNERLGCVLSYPRWDGDWFKVVWATGFVLSLTDRKGAQAHFEAAARQEADYDVISSAKLRVLARLAETNGRHDIPSRNQSEGASSEVYAQLRWFGRSAARWWRTSAALVQDRRPLSR